MTTTYRVLFVLASEDSRYSAVSTPAGRATASTSSAPHELAEALRALGHRVSVGDTGSGTQYGATDVDTGCDQECDILVVVPRAVGSAFRWPSGGTARWRILWLDRMDHASDLDPSGFDYIYVDWAHLRRPLMSRLGLASDRVLTAGHGARDAELEPRDRTPERDPYRVALLDGPEVSLRLAVKMLADLRRHDDRFSLEILTESRPDAQPAFPADHRGVTFCPIDTDSALRAALARTSFLVATSSAVEQYAQVVLQARKAGLVVLASESATAAELILSEYDGVLLEEDTGSPEFAKACAAHIVRMSKDRELLERLRTRAASEALSWRAVARQWVAHWNRLATKQPAAARPRVSVVMAAWNAGPFVQEAVDSILGQTEWDLELIVVDDGSTDETAGILAACDDARLTVIHQENQGVWAALNRGLREARGQLIARMDADDIAHPRRLQHQLDFLDRNPCVALVGTACHKIDAAGRIFMLYPVPSDDSAIKQRLPHGNPFIHPAVLMRPGVLDRVGIYRPHEAEDYDLWLRVSERFEVANLEAPLLKVRRAGNTRVAIHEKAIIESVGHRAERALERCVRGQDAEGYPALRGRPFLGLPLSDLRWRERRPYARTLLAWGDAVLARDRRLALSLYVKATLLAPEVLGHWRACAGCVLRVRGRARPKPVAHEKSG